MFNKTAEQAVDYALHVNFVAPQRIATITKEFGLRYMGQEFGIDQATAVDIRDVMIQAAESAREGAGQAFEDKVWYLIHELARLNETLDSVRLGKLIDRYRDEIHELREGTDV